MAISVTTLTPYKQGWAVNGTSADASGTEELLAAPGAGNCLYVEGIIISSGGAISITLGAGEAAGAVESAILGPISFTANTTLYWRFARPIMLPANKSLTVDASGAATIVVYAEGFTDVSRVPA